MSLSESRCRFNQKTSMNLPNPNCGASCGTHWCPRRNHNSTNIIILLPSKFYKEVKSLYMIESGSWLSTCKLREKCPSNLRSVHVHLCIRRTGEAADARACFSPLIQLHMDGVLHALDRESRDHSHWAEQGWLNARIATVLSIAFVSRSAWSNVAGLKLWSELQ
jgi:hypothetical protein